MKNTYKTFDELKKELGEKFEEYMYKSNIELLQKISKVVELTDTMSNSAWVCDGREIIKEVLGFYPKYKGENNV